MWQTVLLVVKLVTKEKVNQLTCNILLEAGACKVQVLLSVAECLEDETSKATQNGGRLLPDGIPVRP